jgi:hypothetical protein
MKKLFLVSLLFTAVSATAQLYGPINVLSAGTNVIGLTTNTYDIPIGLNLTRATDVGLTFEVKNHTSGATSNVTFNFQHSLDGAHWETTPTFSVTLASASTTNTLVTNLTINAKGYLRLHQGINTNAAGVMTNVLIQAAVKPPPWR